MRGTSDADWTEIADAHNLNVHYDSLRKAASGVALVQQAGMLGNASGAKQMEAVKQLRVDANTAMRSVYRTEAIKSLIESAIEKLEPLPPIDDVRVTYNPSGERDLVLVIADTHYGAEWCVHGLHGDVVNEYNPEIFMTRMATLFSKTVDIVEREDVDHITILFAGDCLDGMLRPSQLMSLRYGVVDSCIRFSEYVANWLTQLARYVRIDAWFVQGNHGEIRPLGSKRGDFADENLERLIPWYLKARLKDFEGRIEIHNPDSKMQMIDVCGHNVLLTHGDEYKSIDEVCKQTMLMYGEAIDILVCGHLHKEQYYPSGWNNSGTTYILRAPCLAGTSNYAAGMQMGGAAAAEAFVMTKEEGRVCQYPIRLQ